MALNWAMLDSDRSLVPLPNEQTISTIDSGVELVLDIPDTPPSTSAIAGGSGGSKKMKEMGRLWLTDQRLIIATLAGAPSPTLLGTSFVSLSIPLLSILSTKFEQPLFGANYLWLEIKPSADGGLTNGTSAEIRLKEKGIFELVALLEKTRERAIYMKRQKAEDEDEGLPLYTSPSAAGSIAAIRNLPSDNPPGYDV